MITNITVKITTQDTQVGAERSIEKGLVSGIMQGSCLGICCFEDNAPIVQKSLEKLYHWSNEWQLLSRIRSALSCQLIVQIVLIVLT